MSTVNSITFSDTKLPNVREYSVSRRLSNRAESEEYSFFLEDLEEITSGEMFTPSPEVRELVTNLLGVDGISWMLVRPLKIYLKFQNNADWEDVHQLIISTIKTQLFGDEYVLVLTAV